MARIPRERTLDASIAFKRDPYGYISRRCRRYGSDVFATRLLLRRTLCMTGPEAARLFYDPERFVRYGAAPEPLQKTLLGTSGVQTLDGAAHRRRKAMFLSLMTPDRVRTLGEMFRTALRAELPKWSRRAQIVLYDELQPLLTRTVCAWAGVPLPQQDVGRRTAQLTALYDYAGRAGGKHVRARLARRGAERWLADVVRDVRSGTLQIDENTALERIANHTDLDGLALTERTAAVELLNVLRPTVAVSVFIVFVAHALHRHPRIAAALSVDDPAYESAFVHEVRRFYPFFPAVPARVRSSFRWDGYEFPARMRVMFDLHGTNHDARAWEAPDEFRPQRFLHWNGDAFTFVPQGGGDHLANHRCPGEWITVELMRQSAQFLARDMSWDVPPQDLSIDTRRLPALPRSRLVLASVRPA